MQSWVLSWLPTWLHGPFMWLVHPHTLGALALFSIGTFILSAVGVPWFFAKVPADFLTRRERRELGIVEHRPWSRTLLRVLKNLLGLVLLAMGLAMLVLPGQGVLAILVALFILDFPGKRRFQRALLLRPRVLALINLLRAKAHEPPLEVPDPDHPPVSSRRFK
ncbi:MAG: PGPGW domain-containing protein [Polyangiaceae bacterium]|nr:PGPGW domain-containing protein [Polyangiaceae bacterium]